MENVSHINPYERITPWTPFTLSRRRKNALKRRMNQRPAENFFSLSRMVGDTHRDLVETGSSFRLCVHKENDDVHMDVVALNEKQKVSRQFTRVITHDDMNKVVKRIHNRMGLILDYSV